MSYHLIKYYPHRKICKEKLQFIIILYALFIFDRTYTLEDKPLSGKDNESSFRSIRLKSKENISAIKTYD
jgi:hypothetical protein